MPLVHSALGIKWGVKALPFISNIIVLLVIAFFIYTSPDIVDAIEEAEITYILAAAFVQLCNIFLISFFLKLTIEPLGKTVLMKDSVTATTLSSIGNFFLPAGTGAALRAAFLKKKYGLSYSKFMATLTASYILVFLVSSIIGVIAIFSVRDTVALSQMQNFLFFFLLLMCGSLLLIVPKSMQLVDMLVSKIPLPTKLSGYFRNITQGFAMIIAGGTIHKIIAVLFMNSIVYGLQYYFIARSLNLTPSIGAMLMLSSLSSLSIIINITPGSLGIREAIFSLSASVLSIAVAPLLLMSLIERFVGLLVISIVWLVVRNFLPDKKRWLNYQDDQQREQGNGNL